jgi:hypothetical protein
MSFTVEVWNIEIASSKMTKWKLDVVTLQRVEAYHDFEKFKSPLCGSLLESKRFLV